MDDYVTRDGIVDPEVRAYIYSLVSALGGASSSTDGRYVLGDDALACLKDIKRWLKLHDEKLSRLDVTRCLAEANLVKGDLLEIIALWPEEALLEDRWRGKVALACLELLVPLTWPMEKELLGEATRNQHRHLPYIQVAQVNYKREVLEHPSGDLLKRAIRLALPAMATAARERTPRDEGILKLVLYFVRNIAMITAPAGLPVEWNEQEVSRSATIKAFDQQDVFTMLLTMASNVMDDFRNQDVVLLEVLFHLLKGVDPKNLFMSKVERHIAHSTDLRGLMDKEDALLRNYAKYAPTRHNRFGTMVWVKRDEERVSTVSGQDVLADGQRTLEKMDKSKKWNRPKQRKQEEHTHMNFDLPEAITDYAIEPLRKFVEEFLDSGFNPLFEQLRRAIEREAERVLESHSQQYWYLVSWFLRAESTRRRAKKEDHDKEHSANPVMELDSFSIVASVLNQETFILLNRYMQSRYDTKEWNELDAGMRCFTQILLTTQEMVESPVEEDQEIAENIQNRIFYEETTHDRVLSILRHYKDQGFSYLDATTEMAHVFLRLLERYSKENGDLQIRSRRKARKRKKSEQKDPSKQQGEDNPDHGSEAEAEDEARAAVITRERKFDFNRFASKFVTQGSVNTYTKFLTYYADLTPEQLKRAHRFFYRVAFKQEMTVLLFRLDIVQLLHRMVHSGTDRLPKSNPMFKDWEELVRQVFRRLVKKMQARPELAVELLFNKIPATTYYLEYGYEKQTIATRPRPPAELEVRGALTRQEQIGVVVAVLIDEQNADLVDWVVKILRSAAEERQQKEAEAAEKAAEADLVNPPSAENAGKDFVAPVVMLSHAAIGIVPESEPHRLALFKNARLRLLLTICDAMRFGDREDPEAPWYIPSSLSSRALLDTVACMQQHRNAPRMTYGNDEDPIPAAEMLRRKPLTRDIRDRDGDESSIGGIGNDDDEEDDGLDMFLAGENEFPFPAGGPTPSRASAFAQLAKRRRALQRKASGALEPSELDAEVLAARRKARVLRELEKRRKIKSEEFVRDSDDESDAEKDEEFYRKEREIAEKRARAYTRAVEEEAKKAGKGLGKRKRRQGEDTGRAKRLRNIDDESSATERGWGRDADVLMGAGESGDDESLDGRSAKAPAAVQEISDADETSEEEQEDEEKETPMSSQSEPRVEKLALSETDGNRAGPPDLQIKLANMDEDEDVAAPATQRRRARAAVLDDSDDD